MKNNKKLTIIVPLYNAKSDLPKLLHSLNHQSSNDFVVIFVDDASNDLVLDYLKDIEPELSFDYKTIRLQYNQGPGNARNIGMEKVQTPFFMFVDADDWLSENYVEALIAKAEKNDADIVVSDFIKIWDSGKTSSYNFAELFGHNTDKDYITCALDFGPWAKIFRSTLLSFHYKFPCDIKGEDGALIPLLYNVSNKIIFETEAIYYYYQRNNSRSNNGGGNYNDIFKAFLILSKNLESFVIKEYKAARQIGYGVIKNAIMFGKTKKDIKFYYDFLINNYPNGYKNDYLKKLNKTKRFFIFLSYKRMYFIQKILVSFYKLLRR